ncbi:MAG: hypothetical protein N3E50_03875 [Candidatus Goldbacteria bacterium]|nr:hypothetical protein [Candidatus Goldiibacteriota bacterium]
MDSEKKIKTEAEIQIERLIQLKMEKEKREQEKLQHKIIRPVKSLTSPFYRKPKNYIKIEKSIYEKIHKIVNSINSNRKEKISKTKFINNILKVVSELNFDFNSVKDIQKLRELFKNIESGK